LKENQEFCAKLESIDKTEDNLKLKFTVIKLIEIPTKALPIEKLGELLGQKIGVININGNYLVRKISKK